MIYYHVDVFSSSPLSGNGLTVIIHEEELDDCYMQSLAQEFKQFETIYLMKQGGKNFRARIFTVEEELDFAGHPILGATAVIHECLFPNEDNISISLVLNKKIVDVVCNKEAGCYQATMNQGTPEFLGTVDKQFGQLLLNKLNMSEEQLYKPNCMEIISTGLPYLLIPITSGIDKAKILTKDMEEQLHKVKAKFLYIFDVEKLEGRTWDNLGVVEDVATGSAAGPAAAYLYKHNICKPNEIIIINQGRLVGRPSKIQICQNNKGEILVTGDVSIIAKGEIIGGER